MIRIISVKNGVGLSRDIQIIQDLLNANGIENEFQDYRTHPSKNKAEINIFVEILKKEHFGSAKKNYLIPNPEWFYREWLPLLRNVDRVLCKTKDAVETFEQLGRETFLTSFTSEDRLMITEKKKSYVHLPGKSSAKGTHQVIEAFSKKGMPQLKIVSQKDYKPKSENVSIVKGIIEEGDYRKIQNENLIHICTSAYEGFGHYMNEAKSTGAVVVTTNASPMNELIRPEFGFGCEHTKETRSNMAIEKTVSVDSICEMVHLIEKTPMKTLVEFGKKARQDYLRNDRFFKKQFIESIKNEQSMDERNLNPTG